MKRLLLGLAIGALIFGSAAAGAQIAAHGLDVNGSLHATGEVIGDTGLSTSQGGVNTNYVNLNNPDGGVRWQYAQILQGDYDPNSPPPLSCGPCGPAYAPAGSVYLRHVDATHGELWFDTGTAWVKVAG